QPCRLPRSHSRVKPNPFIPRRSHLRFIPEDSSDPHFPSLPSSSAAVEPPARFLDLVPTPLERYSQETLRPAQNSSAAVAFRVFFFLPSPRNSCISS
uniref:Uncharacterized protein n=1 Tax=Calidris pygmaea TaxID=425635 RepID=A0A8C3KS19_9CHAR